MCTVSWIEIAGDRRAVASHQYDTVRTKPVREIAPCAIVVTNRLVSPNLLANVPDRNLRSDPGREVKERSQFHALRDGEGDDLIRVVVYHGDHVGALAVDPAMDRALGVLSAPAQIDRVAIEIVFNDIVERHEFRAA